VELTHRTLDAGDAGDDGDGASGAGGAPSSSSFRPRRTRRRWLPLVVLAVVVVGLGVLVYKGLSDATLYFRNADEAVAQRDELGTKRFRLQGTVVGEPEIDGDSVTFAVAYNGVEVDVAHTGTPPDMFKPGIPVVLEGHWNGEGAVFESDRMLIKHDETYESKDDYEERLDDAEQGGEAGQGAGGTQG
jgi:cytochrome c-type biogenesis protein CcmE